MVAAFILLNRHFTIRAVLCVVYYPLGCHIYYLFFNSIFPLLEHITADGNVGCLLAAEAETILAAALHFDILVRLTCASESAILTRAPFGVVRLFDERH